jgi:hypothetical protein
VTERALADKWEARLEREGLASVDSGRVWLGAVDRNQAERVGPRHPLWSGRIHNRPRDARIGTMVARQGQGEALLGAEEMDRRRALLAEHDFRFRSGHPGGPRSSIRPRRDRAIYALYADGWEKKQIATRYRTSFWAVRRAIERVERAYAVRKAAGPTREMLTRFAREADPSLVALVFMLLERTLEQPEAGREILRTARDIPELRELLDG